MSVCMCLAGEMSDMMYDLPDDDSALDELTVECCQHSFPLMYYLQLDSRTE